MIRPDRPRTGSVRRIPIPSLATGQGSGRVTTFELGWRTVTLSVLLWWSYFARLAAFGEHALGQRDDYCRARLRADAYSYGHFVIIAGIIATALGIEDAIVAA